MRILLVDDSPVQCLVLATMLRAADYTDLVLVNSASAAYAALAESSGSAQTCPIDLIFMDLRMPGVDGISACAVIKGMEALQDIPIIMITSSADFDDLTRAFAAGAMDYITKPPHKTELLARLRSALRLKQETDQRKAHARDLLDLMEQLGSEQHRSDQLLLDLRVEQERSEQLLLNILPAPIATRLKHGERIIADSYADVTVLFTDLVNFTALASAMEPSSLVSLLNEVFSCFDTLVETYGLEKIKTIGDSYMVVGGLLQGHADHTAAVANLALAMQVALKRGIADCPPLELRIGIHCGPVTAGVIGTKKFIYDLWGDTVNVASRMESHGLAGHIQVSDAVYARLSRCYRLTARGQLDIKGKGQMAAYLLIDRHEHDIASGA